jgi:dipeptidyl aminopeptidase/acylaminoacyl peptidase
MHGDDDDRVHVDEARELAGQLQALGKTVRYVEYAGGNHGLKRHWKQWTDETVAWFAAYRK